MPVWIAKEKIDQDAEDLVLVCLRDRKAFTPVDVEKIVAKLTSDKVKLLLDAIQLPEGIPGKALGATFIKNGRPTIVIDPSLYEKGPDSRFQHTLGHELGHFFYHTDTLRAANSGFIDSDIRGLLLNDKGVTDQYEWQANRFAAGLRMPKSEIYVLKSKFALQANLRVSTDIFASLSREEFVAVMSTWAKMFGVSKESMILRIRSLAI